MTTATNSHVVIDAQGHAIIAGTGFKVHHIVMEMLKGATPAEIREGYPFLSMAQIHSALAYYYDHKTEMDAKITRSVNDAEALREAAIASGEQPTREELERRFRERGKSA